MRIGIIGAGWLGGTVGQLWVKAGHDARAHKSAPDLRRRLGL
jgi:8-hydroxy-5-deazaflavin:NADPH oxidoreductase